MTHGGKREGAGRPKTHETVVMRVPKDLKSKILAMIEAWKRKNT